jgi:hypothetical protein
MGNHAMEKINPQ